MSEEDRENPTPDRDLQNARMELPRWDRRKPTRAGSTGKPEEKATAAAGPEPHDAFTDTLREAGRGAARQFPWVLVSVGVLVVMVVGGVLFYNHRQESKAEQTRLLGEAARYQAHGEVVKEGEEAQPSRTAPTAASQEQLDQHVTQSLDALFSKGANSDAAITAQLVQAARLFRQGDGAGAVTAYRQFLEKAAATHPLRFVGQEGLVLALEQTGDVPAALTELDALAKDEMMKPQALLLKAELLARQNRRDEAKAAYEAVVQDYEKAGTETALVEEAKKRLKALEVVGQAPQAQGTPAATPKVPPQADAPQAPAAVTP